MYASLPPSILTCPAGCSSYRPDPPLSAAATAAVTDAWRTTKGITLTNTLLSSMSGANGYQFKVRVWMATSLPFPSCSWKSFSAGMLSSCQMAPGSMTSASMAPSPSSTSGARPTGAGCLLSGRHTHSCLSHSYSDSWRRTFTSRFYIRLADPKHGYDTSAQGVARYTRRAKLVPDGSADVFAFDMVLFPINVNGSHWVCGCIDFRKKTIT